MPLPSNSKIELKSNNSDSKNLIDEVLKGDYDEAYNRIPEKLYRTSEYMQNEVFNSYRSPFSTNFEDNIFSLFWDDNDLDSSSLEEIKEKITPLL